jgi:hypothetical protein
MSRNSSYPNWVVTDADEQLHLKAMVILFRNDATAAERSSLLSSKDVCVSLTQNKGIVV